MSKTEEMNLDSLMLHGVCEDNSCNTHGVCDLTTLMVFMKISCFRDLATLMVFMKITDNYRTFSLELEVVEGASSSPEARNFGRPRNTHGVYEDSFFRSISDHSWCL